ncbi:Polysaccharide antigen chain regulator [Legionella steigerwaltii]|uniref:Chain length determinant protein n=1 Tax=Legionella steigerwaltii TaxID=460 RepID=A0A378L4B0_9GAMM|nr:Wzz/FepE/Etk N-terminal domain-containing protein [Legionella steigerwaltii]KTD77123.1 Chain length determinant protein [Legionella steigerwaltii]STY21614.1 Polysaccharide antigen chain regulator [Legionella steigerwaltii]
MAGMQKESSHDTHGVDLFVLLGMIYREKWSILSCALLTLLAGLTYIYLSVPVYEVKAYISAPNEGDVAAFNKGILANQSLIEPLNTNSVYQVFGNQLLSISLKKYFFEHYYLSFLQKKPKNTIAKAHVYNDFSNKLSINVIKNTNPVHYEVVIKGTEPKLMAVWLKQYISLVNNRTVHSLIKSIDKQRAIAIYKLEHEIDLIKNIAQKKKLDHMAQLHEAINIAQNANINIPVVNQYHTVDETNMAYMLGAPVLRAKIKNLSERDSNDPFTPGLRKLQGQLDFYKSFVIEPKEVKVFHLDGTIETPIIPVAPKKRLILTISLLLGILAGGALGITRIFWRNVHALKNS